MEQQAIPSSHCIEKDLRYIWHPCSQMKDYENFAPLHVVGASGCYILLHDGKKLIDAFSSWWCKSLGHQHPQLQAALIKQASQFEHVALVNTTNSVIVELSEKLAQLTPSLNKVFYASEGSSAVEIAIKMSLHTRQIQGELKKTKFVILENSYHGETIGALSLSDTDIYRMPYESLLFQVSCLLPLPYVSSVHDPLWQHYPEQAWHPIEAQLNAIAAETTAIVIEPIIQGAGGMRIYSQDFIKKLRQWSARNHVHLIADEIMTGIGRTGKMLACEHAKIEPDFLCLGKGLTAGWLAFSAVLTKTAIYELFYDDYAKNKSFLHSHTYSGNVLGAAIANQVLTLMQCDERHEQTRLLGETMHKYMQDIATRTQRLKNVRSLGGMVAADLCCSPKQRLGFEVYKKAVERGALLRPLANTIYWFPPLIIDHETLNALKDITEDALMSIDPCFYEK